MNSIEQIYNDFFQFLQQRFNVSDAQVNSCQLTINVDESKQQFGDLSSNAAMILAKDLKKAPREIAKTIIEEFKHPDIKNIELAGPGFLNFFLTEQTFKKVAQELNTQSKQFFTLPEDKIRHKYN